MLHQMRMIYMPSVEMHGACANGEDPDQTALRHRLIRVFSVYIVNAPQTVNLSRKVYKK